MTISNGSIPSSSKTLFGGQIGNYRRLPQNKPQIQPTQLCCFQTAKFLCLESDGKNKPQVQRFGKANLHPPTRFSPLPISWPSLAPGTELGRSPPAPANPTEQLGRRRPWEEAGDKQRPWGEPEPRSPGDTPEPWSCRGQSGPRASAQRVGQNTRRGTSGCRGGGAVCHWARWRKSRLSPGGASGACAAWRHFRRWSW